MIQSLLAIALGGALGAMARFGLGQGVATLWPGAFPLGTLLINLLGCLAIGVLYGAWLNRPELSPLLQQGLMIGFLGAFTTFSTFSLDAWRLLETGQSLLALGYVLLSVCLCLIATWAGLMLTR
ncbi:fluoride efflux transporter CrcB [Pseudomonas sp. G11-1]|uniref:Fluoride-specific ion channel FluC n=1 Tax=Halopseudomonas bauzanensis TaxID=653930 RepID=A0A4U0YJP0_9GAMM|nr:MULTISPECIES: fluoride efflux transporter CrcB [Halopseudomonas]MCO5787587.1 fluoride efflux transporter CrcB [Pseudomonas sp. G11-1]MCO5790682.1 fluoride efflux transporter CrcB [Pseudomonas sp. G11-2]TKA91465.1 fluoride efflux transporter CrcB [Halopseudomonas bauzanensis]WGK60162.1 fluoride efflux transporter CrcB [Halopseudomonas sp. SMJS2]